jgi:hypothetical protein
MGRDVLPTGYGVVLSEIKERVRRAQLRAALAVNREQIELNWQIGRQIVRQQREQGWGAKIIDRLAADLRHEFPR